MSKIKKKLFGIDKFLSSFVNPEFDPECIKLGTINLKPHQEHAVKWLLKNRGLILYHGLGSGKTVCAAAATVCYLNKYPTRKVIVITSTSLQDNFIRTITTYIGDNQELRDLTQNIVLNTYQKFASGQVDCKDALLIVDEVHNLRTKVSHAADDYEEITAGKTANAIIQCAIQAHKVLIMTATPIVNTPYDIENLIAMVEGREPYTETQFSKIEDNMYRLKRYVSGKFSFYEPSITELREYYPGRRNKNLVISMSPNYYKNYMAIEKEQLYNLDAKSPLFLAGKNLKAFYNGIRRASNTVDAKYSPKTELIIQKIKQNPGLRCLVFTHFLEAGQKVIEHALTESGVKFTHINGSMTQKARTQAMDKYNSGEVNVLVISKAGGEGLDLKETNAVFIFEPSWNVSTLEQVIGRAIRYKSHANPRESIVDVYTIFLLKPREYEQYRRDRTKLLGIKETMVDALSADLYMYKYISDKEEYNSRVLNVIQQNSV